MTLWPFFMGEIIANGILLQQFVSRWMIKKPLSVRERLFLFR